MHHLMCTESGLAPLSQRVSAQALSSLLLLCALGACQGASEEPQEEPSIDDPVSQDRPGSCEQGAKCDVFGDDDRHELYELPEGGLHRALARSTGMITPADHIEVRYDGSLRMSPLVPTLGARRNLCEGERFAEQPVSGVCSGFLIAPDLFMTAGHCLVKEGDSIEKARDVCRSNLWVLFGFGYSTKIKDTTQDVEIIGYKDSYKCEDVVAMRRAHACGDDFAILRLDRTVEQRAPLALRAGTRAQPGTELFSIGHPSGLPKKIALNAFVQEEYSPLEAFTPEQPIVGFPYDSDEFVGNSGGAVFEAESGVVEGLSSCGSAGNDFVQNPDDPSCNVIGLCGVNTTCEQFGVAYDMPTILSQLDDAILLELDLVVR